MLCKVCLAESEPMVVVESLTTACSIKDCCSPVLCLGAKQEPHPLLQTPFTTRPGRSGLQAYSLLPCLQGIIRAYQTPQTFCAYLMARRDFFHEAYRNRCAVNAFAEKKSKHLVANVDAQEKVRRPGSVSIARGTPRAGAPNLCLRESLCTAACATHPLLV